MDLIYIVVDGLVHGLDTILHEHLPIEKLRTMDTGQLLNFLDQRQGLLMGDEFRGLDTIHQQLELRQIKGAAGKEIPAAPAPAQLDVIAQRTQCLNIAVHALALAADALRLQQLHQLRHVQQVVFIGLLLKNAQ